MTAQLLIVGYLLVAGLVLGALLHEDLTDRAGSRRVPWSVMLVLPTLWLPIAIWLGLYMAYLIFRAWLADR